MSDITSRRPESPVCWEPILSGALADRAHGAIRAIAGEIDRFPTCGVDRFSLPGGHAGIALFHAYLFLAEREPVDEDRCVAHLEQAMDAAASEPLLPGLHGGIAGIAWTMQHLKGRVLDASENHDFSEFETGLCESLRRTVDGRSRWPHGYDLISGLAGLGVYALERLPDVRARECLELVVAALEQTAEHDRDGIRWFTPPEWVPQLSREEYPAGYYNYGTAHGIPGILALLGRAYAAGVARTTAARLLEGGVRRLLAQEHPPGPGNRFPTFSVKEGRGEPRSRLAWCYGDPGLAAALLDVARNVGEPSWEREAVRIAIHAALRPFEILASTDGGLCHGTGGLAHIYNRMYRVTREEALHDASLHMFELTLRLQRPGAGVGGFKALGPMEPDKELRWLDDPGLLGGAAGIGLALLAGTTSVDPQWDRTLLVPGSAAGTDW
jgi:hypothetical protein